MFRIITFLFLCFLSSQVIAQCTPPSINAVSNQSLCVGSATNPITFTGTGTSYSWTNDNPNIGLPASGRGNINSFVPINNASAPISATITTTPSFGASSELAYITSANSNNVSVINVSNNTIVATIPMSSPTALTAVSPDGSRVYFTNPTVNKISVVSTSSNTVIALIDVGDISVASSLALNPDGSRLYVSAKNTNSVTVINTATNLITAVVSLIYSPYVVTVSSDGSRVYTTSSNNPFVSVINTINNTYIGAIPVGAGPGCLAVSPDGTKLCVTNEADGTVSVINTATNTTTAVINVGSHPNGICFSPDGSRIYVANSYSNDVSIINTATNSVITTLPTNGNQPRGISTTSDGSALYVVNALSNNVTVFNTNTNLITAIIPVGASPNSVGKFIGKSSNCTGTPKTFTITVYNAPNLNITASGPTSFCQGGSVKLTVTGSSSSNPWGNGINSPTITVTQTGNYSVYETNALGCSFGKSQSVTVFPKPSLDFAYTTQGSKANFYNLSPATNNTYFWKFGNDSTSTLTNPITTYKKTGTFQVCMIGTSYQGCQDTVCKSININLTGVEDLSNAIGLEVYPNPNNGQFSISINSNKIEPLSLSISDVAGRIIWKTIMASKNSGSIITPNINFVSTGIYFLKVESGENSTLRKIVIQR